MKIFEYSAKGLALGATIVIIGTRETNAKRAAAKWCSENGVDPGTLQLVKTTVFTGGAQIVYAWNGDY
jgi:hypothetical protein